MRRKYSANRCSARCNNPLPAGRFSASRLTTSDTSPRAEEPPDTLYVDAAKGKDRSPGTKSRPVETLSAALALLPEPLAKTVTIEILGGRPTEFLRRLKFVLAFADDHAAECFTNALWQARDRAAKARGSRMPAGQRKPPGAA